MLDTGLWMLDVKKNLDAERFNNSILPYISFRRLRWHSSQVKA